VLRKVILIVGCLALALGAFLCVKGVTHGGIQALIGGVVLVGGTLFERWRYDNENASIEGNWQRTGERFVDPETGKHIEVLYDAGSGERRYEEIRES
jgi:hypothetical protein